MNPSGKLDKIAVLIPCYNEGLTIAKVVGDFRKALPEAVSASSMDRNRQDYSVFRPGIP